MHSGRIEPCCPAKLDLKSRALLKEEQAASLTLTFKILASGTRLRILHALVLAEEVCVSDLANMLGLKPTAVSNQLQRLALSGIIEPRRDGNQVIYRIVDPCVVKLLDSAWCLTEEARAQPRKRCKK